MVKQFLEKQRQIYQTAGFLSIPGRMDRAGRHLWFPATARAARRLCRHTLRPGGIVCRRDAHLARSTRRRFYVRELRMFQRLRLPPEPEQQQPQ